MSEIVYRAPSGLLHRLRAAERTLCGRARDDAWPAGPPAKFPRDRFCRVCRRAHAALPLSVPQQRKLYATIDKLSIVARSTNWRARAKELAGKKLGLLTRGQASHLIGELEQLLAEARSGQPV